MKGKILLWDNDGTILGSNNPNDKSLKSKVILPGVEDVMHQAKFNFVISGFKSLESEAQNFDPEKNIDRFIELMNKLSISAVAFSPSIGGIHCYVVIKKDNKIIIKKAHEDIRYKQYIGKFKKPDIGMFVVMVDIALEEFNQVIDKDNTIMIGDTWHDQKAAKDFGIPFIDAQIIQEYKV